MPASCWRSIPARSSAAARRWCISASTPGRCDMAEITAIVGGQLIDGTGNDPVGNALVLIDGDSITYAGSAGGQAIPRGPRTLAPPPPPLLPAPPPVHV